MLQLLISQQIDLLQFDLNIAQKLNKYPLTFSLFFTSDDCRTCDADQQEVEDAYEQLQDVIDIYQINCDYDENKQICNQFKIQKFPQLLILNHNKESPAPVEYFGSYDSDKIVDFIQELLREPFIHSTETQATIDYMMKSCSKGIFFFFFVTSDEAPQYFYKLGKQNFGKSTLIVQTGFDSKAYDDFEVVTYQDKISAGEDNLYAVVNGVLQFYPLEVDLQDPGYIEEWMKEIYKYAEQTQQQNISQQQDDDFDDY